MIHVCILASTLFAGQVEEPTKERQWQTPAELQAQVETHAETFQEVRISTIGFTAGGTPIRCLEVAREGEIAVQNEFDAEGGRGCTFTPMVARKRARRDGALSCS